MKKSKEPYNTIQIGIYGLFFIGLIVFVAMLIFQKVEINSNIDCTTGNIGLDLESYNSIQDHHCTNTNLNTTCFKTDLLLDHLHVKGIEDMRCSGNVKIVMPAFMVLGGLE